jgi:hypothetical protein
MTNILPQQQVSLLCEIFLLQLTSFESSVREIPIQLVIEPWREVGRSEGLCTINEDPIP